MESDKYSGSLDGAISFLAKKISELAFEISQLRYEIQAERIISDTLSRTLNYSFSEVHEAMRNSLSDILSNIEGNIKKDVLESGKSKIEIEDAINGVNIIIKRLREFSDVKHNSAEEVAAATFVVIQGGKSEED
jgi:hypothetical protein